LHFCLQTNHIRSTLKNKIRRTTTMEDKQETMKETMEMTAIMMTGTTTMITINTITLTMRSTIQKWMMHTLQWTMMVWWEELIIFCDVIYIAESNNDDLCWMLNDGLWNRTDDDLIWCSDMLLLMMLICNRWWCVPSRYR